MIRAPVSLLNVLLGGLLVALFVLSGLLWQKLETDQRNFVGERVAVQARTLARQLENRLADQELDLRRLAERWLHEGGLSRADWEREAEFLLRSFPGYQSIQWLGADLRMRWLLPSEGNQAAQDFQLTSEHPTYKVAERARVSARSQLSGSFELLQGGRGLILYVPLYVPDAQSERRFDGYLQAIFRVTPLLDELLSPIADQRFGIELLEGGLRRYPDEVAPASPDDLQRVVPLDLLDNTSFSLRLSPTPTLQARINRPWTRAVLVASLGLSLLLVAALYLAFENSRRARALLAANLRLQSEMARREQVEQALRDSREQQQLILDLTDFCRDGLFIVDSHSRRMLYMNRAIHLGLGYDRRTFVELFEQAPQKLIPGYEQWLEEVRQLHRAGLPRFLQRELLRRDGSLQPAEISAQLVSRNGREYLIGVARDNSERLQLEARLQRLSQQDGLTGLHNRRHFDQQLQAEWRRLRRIGAPLSLLMVDIDHFKSYNDTLGHLAGDDALRKVAHLLVECLQREGDIACRYGGEEFAIILTNTRLKGAEHLAARVHQRLAELAIAHPGSPLGRLTLSIGVATSDLNLQEHPHTLIAHSDQALYRAKRNGRNQTCVWAAFGVNQDATPSLPEQ
jgi:diguanylate cyclase (GGDEF)-like protein/PAS domain S-box-containing protein